MSSPCEHAPPRGPNATSSGSTSPRSGRTTTNTRSALTARSPWSCSSAADVADDFDALDAQRLRELFDLTSSFYASRGGSFTEDPYPAFHRLRETGPVHAGIVGPLVGFTDAGFFQGLPYPDRPHFSAFDWTTCDSVFRDGETYISKPPPEDGIGLMNASILYMDGAEHRRHRSLVQPSFLPKRSPWWTERWVEGSVHALIDRMAPNGRADLNVEYFSAIPLLTITGSFGLSIADALDLRQAVVPDGLRIDAFTRTL